MKNGTVSLDDIKYVPEEIYQQISRYTISVNDVYITVAGTIGSVGTIPNELNNANLTENADKLIIYDLNQKYVVHCLASPLIQHQIHEAITKVGQPKLAIMRIESLLFPLPPRAEQKRIVAKIKELLPHVEKYGKAHDELTALNEKFPDAMKKSVLQYAMEGKLVEQREEEGTAKELLSAIKLEKAKLVKEGKLKKENPLPEIKAEEIPFEIPESWMWVRIGDIFTTSSGTTPSKSNPAYYHNAKYNWVRTTDLNNGVLQSCEIKISSLAKTECNLEILPRKSVCIAMYGGAGTIGKNAIIEFDTTINQSVFAIHPNGHCEMKFILYFIQFYRNKWMDFAAGSRKDPNINGNIIKMTILPLPPLAEQKRIVAKIEELLACCGALGNESTA